MNKKELVDAITDKLGDKKTATEAVNALIETIQSAVATGDEDAGPRAPRRTVNLTDNELWAIVRQHTPDTIGNTAAEYCCCRACFEFDERWQAFARAHQTP